MFKSTTKSVTVDANCLGVLALFNTCSLLIDQRECDIIPPCANISFANTPVRKGSSLVIGESKSTKEHWVGLVIPARRKATSQNRPPAHPAGPCDENHVHWAGSREAEFQVAMTPNLQTSRPSLQGQRLWSGLSILSKRSFRSCATSAFEADDERSSSDEDDYDHNMSSGSSEAGLRRPVIPRHAGHDARPTSKKELLGWYSYAFAAEVYVICGIGMS